MIICFLCFNLLNYSTAGLLFKVLGESKSAAIRHFVLCDKVCCFPLTSPLNVLSLHITWPVDNADVPPDAALNLQNNAEESQSEPSCCL